MKGRIQEDNKHHKVIRNIQTQERKKGKGKAIHVTGRGGH
jgi:hypothetical protein